MAGALLLTTTPLPRTTPELICCCSYRCRCRRGTYKVAIGTRSAIVVDAIRTRSASAFFEQCDLGMHATTYYKRRSKTFNTGVRPYLRAGTLAGQRLRRRLHIAAWSHLAHPQVQREKERTSDTQGKTDSGKTREHADAWRCNVRKTWQKSTHASIWHAENPIPHLGSLFTRKGGTALVNLPSASPLLLVVGPRYLDKPFPLRPPPGLCQFLSQHDFSLTFIA